MRNNFRSVLETSLHIQQEHASEHATGVTAVHNQQLGPTNPMVVARSSYGHICQCNMDAEPARICTCCLRGLTEFNGA